MKKRFKKEAKDVFKKVFSSIKKREDLVFLLNSIAPAIYGIENKEPFHLKHLTYYGNPNISTNRYVTFEIKKKSGKTRIIHSPASGLKSILRCLGYILEAVYEPNPSVMGFVAKRSVVDNAKRHIDMQYVYNIDIQDFFHSFDRNRVKMGLWKYLFDMDNEKEDLAFFLAALCTHPIEIDGKIKTVLPQGSPVSPILTNMLCQNLDRRLKGLAKRYRIRYTRYADDITFSSNRNIFENVQFQEELKRIIEDDQKLKINSHKTRLQKKGYRQEVTGVIVNEKLNVHKNYVKQVRMWIYYMEKYGLNKAEQLFRNDYIRDKGHVKNISNPMLSVVMGKLLYLKMVKGEEDSVYKRLKMRFDKVTGKENEIDALLKLWEKEGIDLAMQKNMENNETLYL